MVFQVVILFIPTSIRICNVFLRFCPTLSYFYGIFPHHHFVRSLENSEFEILSNIHFTESEPYEPDPARIT